MSAAVRQLLADAASEVQGLSISPYFSQLNIKPGHGFVRIDRIEYPNRFGPIFRWSVVTVLPGDSAKAEKYIDETVPALVDALSPHLAVDEARPQQLSITDVGLLPCVFINGHREE